MVLGLKCVVFEQNGSNSINNKDQQSYFPRKMFPLVGVQTAFYAELMQNSCSAISTTTRIMETVINL